LINERLKEKDKKAYFISDECIHSTILEEYHKFRAEKRMWENYNDLIFLVKGSKGFEVDVNKLKLKEEGKFAFLNDLTEINKIQAFSNFDKEYSVSLPSPSSPISKGILEL
jgi:hypothetical protein